MNDWFHKLAAYPHLKEWVDGLREAEAGWFSEEVRADFPKWEQAIADLPPQDETGFSLEGGRLSFPASVTPSTETLMEFHPWRKGPFQIGETFINTEWRSDWKWERVSPHLDLRRKRVLDIGCGNGYYLWRMVEDGAEWALGIDPYLPYVMQFKLMQHYGGHHDRLTALPLGVEDLPRKAPVFDTVFSMGILYHQRSPLEHIIHGRDLLAKGGEFILETIVLPPEFNKVTDCLVPEGRYAKMKNVHFLPSVEMLQSWMRKARFSSVEVLDLSKTTTEEQRSTGWMTFQSLPDYLTEDETETVEGHPAPWRAVVRGVL